MTDHPNLAHAMAARTGGTKRRKVLVLVAAILDSGRNDPPISELSRRTGLQPAITVHIIEALEAEGLLSIRRGDIRKSERNVYSLPGVEK